MNFIRKTFLAAGALLPLVLAGGEPRDFIEFLPSCKRHYVDNDKLNNRTWDRAWTIRDERFNDVTNLFLDIEHPETFPRELFDSASRPRRRPPAAGSPSWSPETEGRAYLTVTGAFVYHIQNSEPKGEHRE
jgi:hypothetical protein